MRHGRSPAPVLTLRGCKTGQNTSCETRSTISICAFHPITVELAGETLESWRRGLMLSTSRAKRIRSRA